jgi:hypothetical protein
MCTDIAIREGRRPTHFLETGELAMKLARQAGLGTMEMVVASTVAFIGMFIFGMGIMNFNKAKRKAESETDLSGIKAQILQTVDCDRTFAAFGTGKGTVCLPGTYITLRSRSTTNNVILPQGGIRKGDFVVRAYCEGGPTGGLDIRALGILPAHEATAAARNWKSTTAPNPNFYRKDETTGIPYDWNHPKARILAPGPTGLCSDWFGTPPPTPGCTAPNQFVRNVDLDSRIATCATIPVCTGNTALSYDGTDFSCNTQLAATLTTQVNNLWTTQNTQIATANLNPTSLVNTINYVNSRFDTLGLGPESIVRGYNNFDCQQLSRMRCPDGYLMWRYEARLGSGTCSIGCRKVVP